MKLIVMNIDKGIISLISWLAVLRESPIILHIHHLAIQIFHQTLSKPPVTNISIYLHPFIGSLQKIL